MALNDQHLVASLATRVRGSAWDAVPLVGGAGTRRGVTRDLVGLH